MNPIDLLSSPPCLRLALALLHFLWQGVLIAAVAAALASTLGRNSSRVRYIIHMGNLVTMVLAVAATYFVVAPTTQQPLQTASLTQNLSDTAAPSSVAPNHIYSPPVYPSVASREPVSTSLNSYGHTLWPRIDWRRWAPLGVSLYLLGVILMTVRLVLGLHGGQRLRRSSEAVEDPLLLVALRRQAEVLRLAVTPMLLYCAKVTVPTVVGVLRPAILLPLSFATGLTTEQVEMLLCHELAHIRRWDPFWNVIQRTIEVLLFFHPAVWFISRRASLERENCCDDLVLQSGGSPLMYASSLLDAAQRTLAPSPQTSFAPARLEAAGGSSQIRSRIFRLLGRKEEVRLKRPSLIVCVLVFLISYLVLPHKWIAEESATRSTDSSVNPTTRLGHPLPEITVDATGPEATVKLPNLQVSLIGLVDSDGRLWKPQGSSFDPAILEEMERLCVWSAWEHMAEVAQRHSYKRFGVIFELDPDGDYREEVSIKIQNPCKEICYDGGHGAIDEGWTSWTDRAISIHEFIIQSTESLSYPWDLRTQLMYGPYLEDRVEISSTEENGYHSLGGVEFTASVVNLPETDAKEPFAVPAEERPVVRLHFTKGTHIPGFDVRAFRKNRSWQLPEYWPSISTDPFWRFSNLYPISLASVDRFVYCGLNIQPITWRGISLQPKNSDSQSEWINATSLGTESVSGRVMIGKEPARNAAVIFERTFPKKNDKDGKVPSLYTDSEGHFNVHYLPPGIYRFSTLEGWKVTNPKSVSTLIRPHAYRVEVRVNKWSEVTIGGGERVIVGRLVPEENADGEVVSLESLDTLCITLIEEREREEGFGGNHFAMEMEEGGAFRIVGVQPGEYVPFLTSKAQTDKPISQVVKTEPGRLVIPAAEPGHELEPYDVGEIRLRLHEKPRPILQLRMVAENGKNEESEVVPLREKNDRDGSTLPLLKEILFSESDVQSVEVLKATADTPQAVRISFKKEAARRLVQITGDNLRRRIAVVLDGEILAAPVIMSKIERGDIIMEGDFGTELASRLAPIVGTPQPQPNRGSVRGRVVNSETGDPIQGAFVAIDHSGDAGGSNLERFREEGIYATDETGPDGAFLLQNIAFNDTHPFYVTHPGFIRYATAVAVSPRDGYTQPTVDLQVKLRPGGWLSGSIVDSKGQPVTGSYSLRLSASDGRIFLPPGEDWPAFAHRVERTSNDGRFRFGELDDGSFALEAYLQPSSSRVYFHGSISGIQVRAGVTSEVEVSPFVSGGTIEVALTGSRGAEFPPQAVLSRNLDLIDLAGGPLHPEDERLGKILSDSLCSVLLDPAGKGLFVGFPPGEYAVFAIRNTPVGEGTGHGAVSVESKRVEVKPGESTEITFGAPE